MLYRAVLLLLAITSIHADSVLKLDSKAENYNASTSTWFLEDKNAAMTINDILKPDNQKKFFPNKDKSPDFGLTKSAFWGKIDLQPTGKNDPWFLLFPYNLNTLDLYEVDSSGKYSVYKTGVDLPYNQRVIDYNDLLLPLKPGDQPRTVYFRAKAEIMSMRLPVIALSPMGLVNYTKMNTLLHYIYIGIILAMIIYNTFILVWIKDGNYIYYLLYLIACALLFSLGYNFFSPVYFPNSTGIIMPTVYLLGYLSVFFSIMFTRGFLNTQTTAHRMDTFFKISAILLGPLYLTLYLDKFVFLEIFYFITLFIPAMQIVTGIILYRKYIYARFYTNAWVIYVTVLVLYSLQFFNKTTFISVQMLEFGQAAEATLLSMALSYKMKEFQIRANRDFLTGLFNRNSLQEFLNRQIEAIQKEINKSKPLSMILFDIDHFKKINDNFGHYAGDLVLKELAKVIQPNLRMQDFFCRWGGEEFVIIAPETSLDDAYILAERLRSLIEKHNFPVVNNITISIGISAHLNSESPRNFFQRADEALYRAKSNGRNLVELSK